jgi:hypothetical protein
MTFPIAIHDFTVYLCTSLPVDFVIFPNASSLLNCSRSLGVLEGFIFGLSSYILALKRTTLILRSCYKLSKLIDLLHNLSILRQEGKKSIYPFIPKTLTTYLVFLFVSTFFCSVV